MATNDKQPDSASGFTLDHVGVSVSNLNRSIEFYKQNFGFTLERLIEVPQRNSKVALLKKAGFTIEMFQFADALPLPDYRKTTESDVKTIGVKHFCMRVNDIDSASDFLKRNGVEFASEAAVGVRGLRRFFVKDPDGIPLELTEGPVHS